jgi:hypothetical protein
VQLFHEDANNPDFAAIVRAVDYSALSASPLRFTQGRPGRAFVSASRCHGVG